MSMVMQFRGLSRNGSDLIAATGTTLTRSTFGRFQDKFLAGEEEKLRSGTDFVFLFSCK
jgi:hypothetical protein